MFYLVAAHRWLEDKKITGPRTETLYQGMIVDSSRSYAYVVDVITPTTGGYELSQEKW